MEETITLKSIETKTTHSGQPMWTAITNSGKMSTFDKEVADKLFTLVNKNVVVELELKNNFKNIVRVVKVADNQQPIAQTQVAPTQSKSDATMILSYMKDQVISMMTCIGKETDLNKAWEQAYKNVMESYKKIKADTG